MNVEATAIQHIENDIKNGTKWIYVEFFDCRSVVEINVSAVRTALARWINEECATAIQCNLNSTIEMKNVLVGTIFCGTPTNFITFLVLKNATCITSLQELSANHLDLNIVGKVIQSREHLLSMLLHSDLKLVTIRIFNEDEEHNITTDNNSLYSRLYCAIIVFLLTASLVTLFITFFIQRSAMEHKFLSPSHSILILQSLRN
uniref:Uncharacterized protein n=1 Tax=Setaria digitata TaxID=48799 RepID=A0A915PJW2_9BILA